MAEALGMSDLQSTCRLPRQASCLSAAAYAAATDKGQSMREKWYLESDRYQAPHHDSPSQSQNVCSITLVAYQLQQSQNAGLKQEYATFS